MLFRSTSIELMNRVVSGRCSVASNQTIGGNGTIPNSSFPIPHSPVVVAYARVTGGYAKSMISTDSEIEDYLTFLRGKLKAAIAAGQRIAFN